MQQKQLTHDHKEGSLAKWLSVRLRTKWFWVRNLCKNERHFKET